MRISTAQLFHAGVRDMQNAQLAVTRSQAEISAGKRILTPADDPAGAALSLRIEQDLSRSAQYQRNMDVAEGDLKQEETHLAAVENILFRLRELVIQSGDGALSASERNSIAAELQEHAEELQGIFNAQLANGEYLFSGYQGFERPFVTRPGGVVEFAGDTGQRFLQISSGVDVEVRDNGKVLFEDIATANNTFVTTVNAANTGTGDINVGRIVDQAAYDAVYPDDLVISFDDPLGPGSFSAYRRDRSSGIMTVVSTQIYQPGQPISVAGTEVVMQGTPATGDEFVLQASSRQSLIATVQRAVLGIAGSPDTPAGAVERDAVIAETLNNLSRAESHIFAARAELGSRLNLLDTVREEQAQLGLINRELLSDIEDLDYNEAVSSLSFQSFVLEAAQKSFAKISGLSLFNLLRF